MKLTNLAMIVIVGLALIAIGCEREITGDVVSDPGASEDCLGCHDGATDFGSEVILATRQWENSTHASGNAMRTGSCAKCHTNEGFIAKVTGTDLTAEYYTSVGCFTCHDPHSTGDLSLRTIAAVTLGNDAIYDRGISNLCVNCHQGRRDVSTYVADSTELSGHFGPHHSNQSDMLLGENAYEYDGYDYDDNSWHTTGVADGCVKCHFEVADGYIMGGHTFEMTHEEDENVDACNVGGCHVNALEIDSLNRVASADFDGDGTTEGVQSEIEGLMEELQGLLIAAGLLEYIAEDDAWEPTEDLVVPDADSVGAVFNWAFVHEDQSHGIHNTLYAVALLQSSINYMTTGDPNGVPGSPRVGRVATTR